jgi:hypothetical protein
MESSTKGVLHIANNRDDPFEFRNLNAFGATAGYNGSVLVTRASLMPAKQPRPSETTTLFGVSCFCAYALIASFEKVCTWLKRIARGWPYAFIETLQKRDLFL